MDNKFAKYKSGVKEKKIYGPKPKQIFQAYCEINSTNQWTDKLASLLWK